MRARCDKQRIIEQRIIKNLNRKEAVVASGELECLAASSSRYAECAMLLSQLVAGHPEGLPAARCSLSCADRACERGMVDYYIPSGRSAAASPLSCQTWLGKELPDNQQVGATQFAPPPSEGFDACQSVELGVSGRHL